MPRVPYSPVPDVAPASLPAPMLRVQAEPAAFGATVAGAIQHLGTTEEQVGGEIFQRAMAMQQLRNESEATEALAKYELGSNDLRTKYSSLMGRHAKDGWDQYKGDQDGLRTSIRDGLSSDAVRKLYDRSSLFVMNRSIVGGAEHAAQQEKKYAGDMLHAKINSATDSSRYATDDRDFQRLQTEIDGYSRQLSDMEGHDPVSADQQSYKFRSGALASRIIETAHKDPPKANQMFQEAIKDQRLHSTDYDRVERIVNSELHTTGARTIANGVMREVADPDGYLQRHAAKGARIEGLHPEFASRLQAAIFDAERATGESATIESLKRTTEEQAEIYARHQAMPGGVALHPAAPPGYSRHEIGQAADIQSGKVLDWLHKNADKYGLEFLPGRTGARDPGHIQLAGGAPERTLRSYEVSERQMADMARQKAEILAPGDVKFADSAVQHTINVYRQNRAIEQADRQKNISTIWDALGGDNPPRTLEDLRMKSPDINSAWEQLEGKDKLAVDRSLASIGRQQSDPREYQRIVGESTHRDGIADFINEDIINNNKLSDKHKFEFIKKQQQLSAHAEEDPRVGYAMGPNGIGPLIPDSIRTDKNLMNVLRGAMRDQIQQYQEVFKTFPGNQELQDMGKRLMFAPKDKFSQFETKELAPAGGGFGTRSIRIPTISDALGYYLGRGEPAPIEMSVPSADAERIKNFHIEKGLPVPDDREIQRIYVGEQYTKLYGKPKKESK